MRKSLLGVSAVALLALALVPAAGAAEEQNNRVRFGASYLHPNADPKIEVETAPGEVENVRAEIDDDIGFYAEYERMILPKLGIDFGALWSEYDVDISGGDRTGKFGSLKTTPIWANLLFHPAPQSHTDFYIGGGFTYVLMSEVDIENDFGPGGVQTLDIDDDKTWNAQVGLDIRFGESNIALNLDAKYIQLSGDSELGSLDVDPIIGSAGLAIRW